MRDIGSLRVDTRRDIGDVDDGFGNVKTASGKMWDTWMTTEESSLPEPAW